MVGTVQGRNWREAIHTGGSGNATAAQRGGQLRNLIHTHSMSKTGYIRSTSDRNISAISVIAERSGIRKKGSGAIRSERVDLITHRI